MPFHFLSSSYESQEKKIKKRIRTVYTQKKHFSKKKRVKKDKTRQAIQIRNQKTKIKQHKNREKKPSNMIKVTNI